MVAIAVSMVMAICRIFCQIVFVSISRLVLVDVFFFLGTDFSLRSRNFADYADFHLFVYTNRSDYLDDTEN